MCKQYHFSNETAERIKRIICEKVYGGIQEATVNDITSCKKINVRFLKALKRNIYKRAAKECNVNILKRTNIYISKNTLELVIRNLNHNNSFYMNYFINDIDVVLQSKYNLEEYY